MADSFASEKPAPPSTVSNENGQSPKELVGGVDVFEAFRSDIKQKPQWSDSPVAQTAIKALTALSDSPSVSDHMGGHDDDQYYADEPTIDGNAVDETPVDETPVEEDAPLQDVKDAPLHAPDGRVPGANQRTHEDYPKVNAPMPTRRLDVALCCAYYCICDIDHVCTQSRPN